MAGVLSSQSGTASPFPSDASSATGYQSMSYTMWPSYTQVISTILSGSQSASPIPSPSVYSPSPLASSLSFPTISASSTHLAPVITPPQDTITFTKQDLIYICVPIVFVMLLAFSFAYNAHQDKKRLKKVVSQYRYATPTVKLNPANPQNHSIV